MAHRKREVHLAQVREAKLLHEEDAAASALAREAATAEAAALRRARAADAQCAEQAEQRLQVVLRGHLKGLVGGETCSVPWDYVCVGAPGR